LPYNILLTGANGYIGQRLIPVLLEQGHNLYCCVRDKERFEDEQNHPNIKTIEVDFYRKIHLRFSHNRLMLLIFLFTP